MSKREQQRLVGKALQDTSDEAARVLGRIRILREEAAKLYDLFDVGMKPGDQPIGRDGLFALDQSCIRLMESSMWLIEAGLALEGPPDDEEGNDNE